MKTKKNKFYKGCSREMTTEFKQDYCYLCRDGMELLTGCYKKNNKQGKK